MYLPVPARSIVLAWNVHLGTDTSHIDCGMWHVAVTFRDYVMICSSKSASRLPQPYLCPGGSLSNHSRDVVAKIKMKRLNSHVDDNIPIYIFILLFAILLSQSPGHRFQTSICQH